LMYSHQ